MSPKYGHTLEKYLQMEKLKRGEKTHLKRKSTLSILRVIDVFQLSDTSAIRDKRYLNIK